MARWLDHPMTRSVYLAAIPLGPDGVTTGGRLNIAPLVALNEKPETLLDPLFDVNRNWPVLFTLGCSANAAGCNPVGRLAGVTAVNVPAVVLILNPKTWLVPCATA